jgi:hypothetical protein
LRKLQGPDPLDLEFEAGSKREGSPNAGCQIVWGEIESSGSNAMLARTPHVATIIRDLPYSDKHTSITVRGRGFQELRSILRFGGNYSATTVQCLASRMVCDWREHRELMDNLTRLTQW